MMGNAVTKQNGSLSARFATKLVIEVLPAAAVSLLGSFLISQYQFHHSVATRPPAQRAAPASAEMMQLVRDEHTAIMSYLKAEQAAQQHRHALEDEAVARAVAEAKAPPPPARIATAPAVAPVAALAATPVSMRTAVTMPVPSRQPLVLTHTEQTTAAVVPAEAVQQPQTKSLLAATLDVKDQVVDTTLHATWHAVSAIGSIPSWLAGFGSRIGGGDADANAGPARLRAS
jgi:hypothetical protein